MGYFDSTHKKLFIILLILEGIIFILSIVGKQLMTGFMLFFFKILVLVLANCCEQSQFAALYSVFALLAALYAFSPVGLFMTGHGNQKTTAQNICCVFIVVLSLVCSYLGYLYTKALEGEEVLERNNDQDGPSNPLGGYGGNFGGNYGGFGGNREQEQVSRFQYQAGNTNNRSSENKKEFRAFSGQGYSLD